MRYVLRVLLLAALAAAVLVQPAAGAGLEPNDSNSDPFGPLAGGQLYNEAIDTSNDQDWYVFYTPGRRQIDIAVTLASCPDPDPDAGGCMNLFAELVDESGDEISGTQLAFYVSGTQHIRYTAPRADAYYLEISGDEGNGYEFRVDPADAVTTEDPRPCRDAMIAKGRAERALQRARQRRRNASGGARRARLRRAVRARKADLRRANEAVARRC